MEWILDVILFCELILAASMNYTQVFGYSLKCESFCGLTTFQAMQLRTDYSIYRIFTEQLFQSVACCTACKSVELVFL